MKVIFNIAFVFLACNSLIFAQEQTRNELLKGNEVINKLFKNYSTNNQGKLCVQMKNSGVKFLMYIDDSKESQVSDYNEIYCIKDSIKLIEKHGNIKIKRDENEYWRIQKEMKDIQNGKLIKIGGLFKSLRN